MSPLSAFPGAPAAALPASAHAVLLAAHPDFRPLRVRAFGAVLGLVAGLDLVAALLFAMAGPQVQAGLHAAPRDFLWALTSYAAAAVLAHLALLPLAARIGLRRFTLAGTTLFAAGALGCAAADSLAALVLARALQGLGGGALFSASRILAQFSSQPQERLALFWGFGTANFALLALAPLAAGALVARHGWPLLFGLQALLALALLPLVAWIYPAAERRPLPPAPARPDWAGVLAFAAGALLLLHALEHLRYLTRAELPALAGFGLAGGALIAAALRRFRRHPDPWLDPRRLAGRRYRVGLAFYGAFYLIAAGWSYLVPPLLVEGLGLALIDVGLLLSLGGLATLAAVVVFHLNLPRLMRKRRYVALGYLGLALAFAWMAQAARPGAGVAAVLPAIVLQGAMPVLALLQVALMTFVGMPDEDFAHAYVFKGIVRELVNALGAGLVLLQLHHGAAAEAARLAREAVPAAALQPLAVSLAAGQILLGLALACAAVAAAALLQRALK